MKSSPIFAIFLAIFSLSLPACNKRVEKQFKVVVTTPQVKDVNITQEYVCQIQSQHHIKLRAFERGYLDSIPIKEGQQVAEGDLLFKVIPTHYQAKLDVEQADVQIAQLQYNDVKKKYQDKIVSQDEVTRSEAKLKKSEARAKQAEAEVNFAIVKAPFEGVVGRLDHQQGSLVDKGEILTTLSDDSTMWVYFNVSEARYLEYMAERNLYQEDPQFELVLENGKKFNQAGKLGAINSNFDTKTGGIPFRADFPNPDRVLRHGQTGRILIHRVLKDAIVVPQRATFEVLNKRYLYVVDKENVVHRREIVIQNELDDIFVIKSGLDVDDKIVLEGIRQVRDGDKVEYEVQLPEQALAK